MRALRLFWTFARIGALNELQYRANLVIQLLESAITLATGLIVLALVFNQVADLNGWSHAELLAVMGVYTLVGGIIGTFIQPNMERLIADVRRGTLDYVLTKPEDSQVLVSVREIRIWRLVDVALGLIILVIAAREVPGELGIAGSVAFVAALALGAAMIYCFWLILTTVAFWVIRVDEIVELFQGVYQAGRWPVTIYPEWLRLGLTFLIPIAFAVTVPAEAFVNRLSPETLGFAVLLAAALLLFTRLLWRIGIRRYSGASA
jgi:viologen exporter family transport system permease protein